MENLSLKVNFALIHKMVCNGVIDGYAINEVAINDKPSCDSIIYWEVNAFPAPIVDWIFKTRNRILLNIIPSLEIDIRLKTNQKSVYSSEYEVITCEKIITVMVRNRQTKEISSQTQSFVGDILGTITAKFKSINLINISVRAIFKKIEQIIPQISIFRRK